MTHETTYKGKNMMIAKVPFQHPHGLTKDEILGIYYDFASNSLGTERIGNDLEYLSTLDPSFKYVYAIRQYAGCGKHTKNRKSFDVKGIGRFNRDWVSQASVSYRQ